MGELLTLACRNYVLFSFNDNALQDAVSCVTLGHFRIEEDWDFWLQFQKLSDCLFLGWMFGKLDGRVGIFPADYVEPVSRSEARKLTSRQHQVSGDDCLNCPSHLSLIPLLVLLCNGCMCAYTVTVDCCSQIPPVSWLRKRACDPQPHSSLSQSCLTVTQTGLVLDRWAT